MIKVLVIRKTNDWQKKTSKDNNQSNLTRINEKKRRKMPNLGGVFYANVNAFFLYVYASTITFT